MSIESDFLRVRTERDEAIEQRDKFKAMLDEFAVGAAMLYGAIDMKSASWVPDLIAKMAAKNAIEKLNACLKEYEKLP